MTNSYNMPEEPLFGHKFILSPIKLLLITAFALWSDSLVENFKYFSREVDARVVLVTEEPQNQALVQAVETTKDIVVVSSPSYLGGELSFVETLRNFGCHSPTMVLCSNNTIPSLEELQKLNIQGIISLNTACLKELENAIYAVLDNQHNILKEQYIKVHRFYHKSKINGLLNPFEKEILSMVSADMKDKEIAERLGISNRAITYHLPLIYAKLGVNSRAGAVGEAISRGILSPYQVLAAKASNKNL